MYRNTTLQHPLLACQVWTKGLPHCLYACSFSARLYPAPIPVSYTHLDVYKRQLYAQCEVKTSGKTGVEMEALCGVSVALLTVYDMAKAIDRSMEIYDVRVVSKAGGKSGDYERQSR